jgi:translocator protein
MKLKDFFQVLGWVFLSEAAGLIGSVFTAQSIPTWYAQIQKPMFAPPNWVFGPVWTTLFALMGIAAYLVWKTQKRSSARQIALGLFALQLVLNVVWSLVFFGLRNPGLAFLEIILLWLAIAATMYSFARVSKSAALLLVPYLAWVSFAGFLNYRIWQLNKVDSGLETVFCTQDAKLCPDGSYVGRSGPDCAFDVCPGN